MKPYTPEQLEWLESAREICLADLYTITLKDGTVLRFTSRDTPIKFEDNVYHARDILIERGALKTAVGVEVQTLDLTVSCQASPVPFQFVPVADAECVCPVPNSPGAGPDSDYLVVWDFTDQSSITSDSGLCTIRNKGSGGTMFDGLFAAERFSLGSNGATVSSDVPTSPAAVQFKDANLFADDRAGAGYTVTFSYVRPTTALLQSYLSEQDSSGTGIQVSPSGLNVSDSIFVRGGSGEDVRYVPPPLPSFGDLSPDPGISLTSYQNRVAAATQVFARGERFPGGVGITQILTFNESVFPTLTGSPPASLSFFGSQITAGNQVIQSGVGYRFLRVTVQ